MTTPLGTTFSTDKKVVAQTDLKFIGSTIESLIVELDQEKFEQLLSSGSVSPKFIQKYHKISSETCSLASSKAF